MLLPRTAFAIALVLSSSQVGAQPATVPKETREKIAKLIDRLTEVDRSDCGYTRSNLRKRFLPTDAIPKEGNFRNALSRSESRRQAN